MTDAALKEIQLARAYLSRGPGDHARAFPHLLRSLQLVPELATEPSLQEDMMLALEAYSQLAGTSAKLSKRS